MCRFCRVIFKEAMQVTQQFEFEEQTPLQHEIPLAARMRPRCLDEYIGQEHLLGLDKSLRSAIEKGRLHSMILWGPPGVGKTTLAQVIAHHWHAEFISLSAVMSGVKDIRSAVDGAQRRLQLAKQETLVFVDEVHRFNKAQQDAFLPYVEDGTIKLIGATTENPSFELNNALLSRTRVYVLRDLKAADLHQMLSKALADDTRGYAGCVDLDEGVADILVKVADGDGRKLYNLLEIAVDLASQDELSDDKVRIGKTILEEVIQSSTRRFDKGGDLFYEQISALHKSVRGSCPDAALYWYARMLEAGCDPLYIARRAVRMASEDIGNADPRALQLALNAWDTQERLGHPEGELAIAQAIVYLASAPKSNAVYTGFKQALEDVKSQPSFDVPLHLRNAPTSLMKSLDYGEEYRYAHDEPHAFAAGEVYLPEELKNARYYFPTDRGLEKKISEKLLFLQGLNELSPIKRYETKENTHHKLDKGE